MKLGLAEFPDESYVSFGISKGSVFLRSDKTLKEIVNDLRNTLHNVERGSKNLKVPSKLLFKILAGSKKKIRLEYLKRICRFLVKKGFKKYRLQNLEASVYSISLCHGKEIRPFLIKDGRIIRKIPFSFDSPEGIVCLTFPYGDGYISKDRSGYVEVGYTNAERELHDHIINCMKEVFGDVAYGMKKIKGGWNIYFTGVVGRIYLLLGYKFGDKVEQNPSLIPLLKNLRKKKSIGAFISQMADDEGSFNPRTGIFYITMASGKKLSDNEDTILEQYRNVKYENYIPQILKDVRRILKRVEIKTNFRKPCPYYDRTKKCRKLVWHLTISGVKNLLLLRTIVDLKRTPLRLRFESYCEKWFNILKTLEQIENEKGYFTINDLAIKLRLPSRATISFIVALLKSDMLKTIEKGKRASLNGRIRYEQSKFQLRLPKEIKSHLANRML